MSIDEHSYKTIHNIDNMGCKNISESTEQNICQTNEQRNNGKSLSY